MRKLLLTALSLLLVLAMSASVCAAEGELRGWQAGDGYVYVTLGEYPQWIEGGDPHTQAWKWSREPIKDTTGLQVEKSPILWRVLTEEEDHFYLLSEYVLFAMPMHVNYTEYKTLGKDFGQTELCHYLNSTFTEDAFTMAETEMLAEYETYGKVFLADAKDVQNKQIGMGLGEGLKGWGTEYAVRVTGLYVFLTRHGMHSAYWVRNQSTTDKRHARCTKDGGQLGHIISDRDNEGARPAVHLKKDSYRILSGSGTVSDPYVLVPSTDASGSFRLPMIEQMEEPQA